MWGSQGLSGDKAAIIFLEITCCMLLQVSDSRQGNSMYRILDNVTIVLSPQWLQNLSLWMVIRPIQQRRWPTTSFSTWSAYACLWLGYTLRDYICVRRRAGEKLTDGEELDEWLSLLSAMGQYSQVSWINRNRERSSSLKFTVSTNQDLRFHFNLRSESSHEKDHRKWNQSFRCGSWHDCRACRRDGTCCSFRWAWYSPGKFLQLLDVNVSELIFLCDGSRPVVLVGLLEWQTALASVPSPLDITISRPLWRNRSYLWLAITCQPAFQRWWDSQNRLRYKKLRRRFVPIAEGAGLTEIITGALPTPEKVSHGSTGQLTELRPMTQDRSVLRQNMVCILWYCYYNVARKNKMHFMRLESLEQPKEELQTN